MHLVAIIAFFMQSEPPAFAMLKVVSHQCKCRAAATARVTDRGNHGLRNCEQWQQHEMYDSDPYAVLAKGDFAV